MDYTYTIIDTDAATNLQLQLHLQEHDDMMRVGNVENIKDGLNTILKYAPDIVIINLNENAFEHFQMVMQLHQYLQRMPILIGFSKSQQHAYNAIKNGFFDYWLLPHNEFDIRKTVMRLRKQLPKDFMPRTICLKSYRDYHYIDTNEILYLKADNNATDFIMRDGSQISAFRTLKSFERKLPKNFIRIHQSYILNSKYVKRINYGKSICTLKSDEQQLPFSKSYREKIDALKDMLSKSAITTQD
ncbi:MAG: LytTR family transcriptional regulator DNA-binding domain-containing protein [Bacteroidota bacterium]